MREALQLPRVDPLVALRVQVLEAYVVHLRDQRAVAVVRAVAAVVAVGLELDPTLGAVAIAPRRNVAAVLGRALRVAKDLPEPSERHCANDARDSAAAAQEARPGWWCARTIPNVAAAAFAALDVDSHLAGADQVLDHHVAHPAAHLRPDRDSGDP